MLLFFPFSIIIYSQGPEWDSSDEEDESMSKASGKKNIADRKRSKRAQKQAQKASLRIDDGISDDEDGDNKIDGKKKKGAERREDPTIIYVGHLPVELEERDLRTFLSQFGDVIHSRISRSIQTGHSRGYGFVQFSDPEVAKIVAETLQGYFLGKKRLVCHLVDNPDDGLFFDTDRLIAQRKNDLQAERKRRRDNLANASKMKEITARLVQREKKKRKKLQDLGIDYDFPGYEGSLAQSSDSEAKEVSTPKSDTKKKKKRRSSSVGSIESTTSDLSATSSSSQKKSKRKDSIGSVGSTSSKSKRKDSIGSMESSNSSTLSSGKKKKKKRMDSDASEKAERTASTPTNASKKKKNKKKKQQ